jgi:hypothetical protein
MVVGQQNMQNKNNDLFLFYLAKPARITYGTKRQAWTDPMRGNLPFSLGTFGASFINPCF